MSEARAQRFDEIRDRNLKVARAWAIKETARDLWSYVRRGWAEKAWKWWLGWVDRCRLALMKKAGQTLKKNLWGILNAIVLNVTNATAEAINSRIQWLKRPLVASATETDSATPSFSTVGDSTSTPRPSQPTRFPEVPEFLTGVQTLPSVRVARGRRVEIVPFSFK